MQGCITFLIIILLIALLIKFPFFIMCIAVILYGFTTYQKNKKENVKSKVGPTILIIGILLTLGSCASSFADDETDKENIAKEETAKVEESAVEIEEEKEEK